MTELLIGLVMGLLSGVLGIGGGVVLVPMLALILGTPQHLAQGISLLVIIPTSISGLIALRKSNLVDFRAVRHLAAGSVAGALLSANFAHFISPLVLKKIFGIFIIYAGMRMISPPKKR
ncbi:MAG: sulfite exporter TauE/SafE family protein [Acidaminococcales bacterium]|jgi:uncharacterized membrane protein YfcA|nr:sulfite exporter TauE/SafE family protein [Acidaminococcales bacterium]